MNQFYDDYLKKQQNNMGISRDISQENQKKADNEISASLFEPPKPAEKTSSTSDIIGNIAKITTEFLSKQLPEEIKIKASANSETGNLTGREIKNMLNAELSKKNGSQSVSGFFDGVDDSKIEANVPAAQSALEANIRRGTVEKDYLKDHPYYISGLATFYAAAEDKKYNVANTAYQLSHEAMPSESLTAETTDNSDDSFKASMKNMYVSKPEIERFWDVMEKETNDNKASKEQIPPKRIADDKHNVFEEDNSELSPSLQLRLNFYKIAYDMASSDSERKKWLDRAEAEKNYELQSEPKEELPKIFTYNVDKLSESKQRRISALSKDYAKCKTDEERQACIKRAENLVPPYLRYREEGAPLAVEHQTQQNVHDYACVLVSAAMMMNYFGSHTSAKELYNLMNSYKFNNKEVIKYSDMESKVIYEDMLSTVNADDYKDKDEKALNQMILKKCKEELKKGIPVMVEIGYDGSQHSVVVYGIKGDGTTPSDFLAMDPYRDDYKNKTGTTNTLQDSIDMFSDENPRLSFWRTYTPIE